MNTELSNAEVFLSWIKTKSDLNKRSTTAGSRFVKRGDVYWCHFGINIGSEMSKSTARPAIIVQNHVANSKSPNTIVVPITHDTAVLPCLVPITPVADSSGSTLLNGQANTSNIVCVSKARLGDKICKLSALEMKKIDESIAKSVDLMRYYKDISDKNANLNTYITKIKEERNTAQDMIKAIKEYLDNPADEEVSVVLSKIEGILDNA